MCSRMSASTSLHPEVRRLGVLKPLHRPLVAEGQKLVGTASDLFYLAGLPPCFFLYRPLVSLLTIDG